jgi:hypothetical protein
MVESTVLAKLELQRAGARHAIRSSKMAAL